MTCKCRKNMIGAGFSLNIDSAMADAGLSEINAQASAIIGDATSAYADAQAAVDDAVAIGKDVEAAVQELDMTGRDVGNAILAVAASPLTHTALGALAVAAPPFTTVLAGIGEALVGVAAAAVPLVTAVESVWNDVFMSYTAKAARQWGVTEAEAQKIIDAQGAREDFRKSFDAAKSKATETLADLKVRAARGDRKAIEALAALEALMQSDTLLLTTVLRFGCDPRVSAVRTKGTATGLTPWELCDVARAVVADQERAALMSDAEFERALQMGRPVYTDKNGKQHGFRLDVVSEGGKQIAALIDVSTGKTIAKGGAAMKEWQSGFHFLIDEKTRRVKLTDALRSDYLDAFKGSLYKRWEDLAKAASQEAERREKDRIAKLEARAKAEAKRQDILTGETAVAGTLVTEQGVREGKFRVAKSGAAAWLVRTDGYVMKAPWAKA